MKVVGLDGCRGEWIAVWMDEEGNGDFEVISQIVDILKFKSSMTMIDIPIGLPETERRACDLEARKILGAGRSRVFLDARRPLLTFNNYAEANRWGKKNGPGVAKQLFCILGKIREVDEFISPEGQETFRETHPELVFQRLNENKLLANKKSLAGRRQRCDLIRRSGLSKVEQWIDALPRKRAKPDDLLDACAGAIVARDALNEKARHVPEGDPELDARGLRMQIWY